MRRVPTLASLLSLVALAGCAAPGGSIQQAPPPYECFLASAHTSWIDPELYDELPGAAARADLQLAYDMDTARVPITQPDIAARYREPSLLQITWRPPHEMESQMRLAPAAPGEWRLESSVTWENETLVAHTRAFLEGVGLGDHPERPAWERAIVASRHYGPYPAAYLVATPDLDVLWQRLSRDAPPTELNGTLGDTQFVWDDWRVHVAIGTHRIRTIEGPESLFELVVDERGAVSIRTDLQRGEDPTSVLRARAGANFAKLGLTLPELRDVKGGAGC